MKNRTVSIHYKRILNLQELIPVHFSDNDLNWLIDWILAIGIGTIHSALDRNPKLTLHDLFLMTTKLPEDFKH